MNKKLDVDYEKWENILNEEGLGDIDKEEGFVLEKISNNYLKIEKLLTGPDLNSLIKKIEDEKSVSIYTDFGSKKIIIVDQFNGDNIGEIYNSTYKSGKIEHDNHLFLKVEDKYRGKLFGKILFSLYEKMGIENGENLIPEKEYSRKPSRIIFSELEGYEIKGKIFLGNTDIEDFTDEDRDLINLSLKKGKNLETEDYLPFDVILEK